MPYVRPDGAYYEHLKQRGLTPKNATVTLNPWFNLENGERAKATGTHVYGAHHPDRASYDGGGACPIRGGDYADYPKASGGAGWPTNYEEVTPLCDAVLLDIKLTANLGGGSWNNPTKYFPNAGIGRLAREYQIKPVDEYGRFSDVYHTQSGIINPQQRIIGPSETITYKTVQEPVIYTSIEN